MLYTAYRAGEPDPLPPLPFQYADFAVWQRGRVDEPAMLDQLAHWLDRLTGASALELLSDHPRTSRRTSEDRLRAIAERETRPCTRCWSPGSPRYLPDGAASPTWCSARSSRTGTGLAPIDWWASWRRCCRCGSTLPPRAVVPRAGRPGAGELPCHPVTPAHAAGDRAHGFGSRARVARVGCARGARTPSGDTRVDRARPGGGAVRGPPATAQFELSLELIETVSGG
ncbi:hypothetical protein BLA60_17910 [Actinophytocola xinjiangensis]|uniref:Uncharacterized protein n=1 Tax=Actinophytocola xinjiangensis TaxID=485602 RepID=A0A7Z1AXU7_9PSEU|nr:hypothetical protein BLA60_17910 [Actinophytocola xinjiangensis]